MKTFTRYCTSRTSLTVGIVCSNNLGTTGTATCLPGRQTATLPKIVAGNSESMLIDLRMQGRNDEF